MSNDMKRFFEDIKESKDFFLLRRLYKMPSSVLGNKQDMDEAEKEYYHLPDYFNLLMNNNLTRFITLALCDQEFCDKADVQVWRKFAFFLYDSADFKQYYHMVDNPDLLALLSGKMTLNDYFQKYGKPKSGIGIYSQYTIYKKYKRLYKHHFPEEQVDGYDVKQSKNALACVNSRLDVIKEQTIGRQQEKNSILSWVENDNYLLCGKGIILDDSLWRLIFNKAILETRASALLTSNALTKSSPRRPANECQSSINPFFILIPITSISCALSNGIPEIASCSSFLSIISKNLFSQTKFSNV